MTPRAALLCALALAPAAAGALEPRYDHRDTNGPSVDLGLARDTVAISGQPSVSRWRPTLRLAWSFDATGEGGEVVFGAQGSPRGTDPGDAHVGLSLDARYRGYFGLDVWKTFFDVGLWAPLVPRLAAGPLVGLGLAWDPSRAFGLYAGGSFSTAFGGARIASFGLAVGAQIRFE
jgi:hypothetical protein